MKKGFKIGTTFHLGITPRYLLLHSDEDLRDLIVGDMPIEKLRERLRQDAAEDITYPIGDCPEWDLHTGCPGHPITTEEKDES